MDKKYSLEAVCAFGVLLGVYSIICRSRAAKKELYSAICRNLKIQPGIPATDIIIVLNEIPLQNWGISGGKPADEVELGFTVKV